MERYFVCVEDLKKELETYECIDDKIKKLSSEILNCSNVLTDEKKYLDEAYLLHIIPTDENKELSETIDGILKNYPLRSVFNNDVFAIIGNKIFSPYYEYLEKARALLEYYKSIRDLETHSIGAMSKLSVHKKNSVVQNRIVWKAGVSKLLKTFFALSKNGFLRTYSREEILAHFVIEGQEQVSISTGKTDYLQWFRSDCSFSIFIDELSKRKCINDRKKYRMFCSHFVNKHGERFQYLAQKKNYTDNVVHKGSGKIIRNILDSTGMHAILLLFYALLENIDFMMCIFLD